MRAMSFLSWRVAFRDAAIVIGVAAVAGSVRNVAFGGGIPFVQHEKHEILVPCPETSGEAPAVAPSEALRADPHVLVIDARERADFGLWHAPRAENVVFDYLEPADKATVRRIASSGAREVIVYGDGGEPDSGEQLAKELAGKGIRNVRFVAGGAPAIQAVAGKGAAP